MEGWEPMLEVAMGNRMYWSMPPALSAQLYKQMFQPVVKKWALGYSWEWGVDGEAPSNNMYMIDVDTMTQRNVNTQCQRDLRIVWVQK